MLDRVLHAIKLGGQNHGMMYISQDRIIITRFGNFAGWLYGLIIFSIIYLIYYTITWTLFLFFDLTIWYMNLFLIPGIIFSMIYGWSLYSKSRWENAKKNMDLPPDEILKINRGGYQILNTDISRIKIITLINASPRIIISSNNKDRTYIIYGRDKKKFEAHKEIFKKIFGDRFISNIG
jgi:hypothetical protein